MKNKKIISSFINNELTAHEIIELLVAEREENETLSAANNDLKKEILILKNKLEVRYEGD